MNKLRKFATGLAVAALPLVFSIAWTQGGTAFAQQAAQEMEEVVVVGAPVVRQWTERGRLGGNVETIELTRRVSYADLDLTLHADVLMLEERIENVARESCKTLSDMFPLDRSDSQEIESCTRKAIAGTEEQVKAAIAAAS
jgi:UrcA family protein